MNDTKAQAAWHPYRNAWEAAQAERAKREEEERQAQVERMTRLIAKRAVFPVTDIAHYIEHEAGQLIRKARAERDKAWREVAATHATSRQKDEQIRKLTRELRAAEGRARRARRQLGQLEASYDALLMRHAFENANQQPAT